MDESFGENASEVAAAGAAAGAAGAAGAAATGASTTALVLPLPGSLSQPLSSASRSKLGIMMCFMANVLSGSAFGRVPAQHGSLALRAQCKSLLPESQTGRKKSLRTSVASRVGGSLGASWARQRKFDPLFKSMISPFR